MRAYKKKGLYRLLSALLCLIIISACSESDSESQVSEVPPPDDTVEVSELPVVVSGNISYQDLIYGKNGFTGSLQNKAVRYVPVDLVDYYGAVVDSTVTDELGNYSVSGAGIGLRLRVLAKSDAAAGISVAVKNLGGSLLSVSKDVDQSLAQSTLNVSISYSNSLAGAFNIVDVYTAAAQFISGLSSLSLPPLTVFWEKGSQTGTYFCPGTGSGFCSRGKGIYVLGGNSSGGGDTDEYDDDVLWHEFAHYLENAVGISDSPGGVHYLTDNDLDLRLAWSEGWGEFFPVMIKQWLKDSGNPVLSAAPSLPSTYFIDTYGSSVGIALDLADPDTWFCPGNVDCFVYSSSEVSIAKVLVKSLQRYDAQTLWNVYQYYLPNGSPYPATLETFWDGWLSLNAPDASQLLELQAIYNDRLVYYQHDAYEADDVLGDGAMQHCMMGNCQSELRHLYKDGAADVDLVAFDVQMGQSYQLETYDLSNGADTEIRVLDARGNVVSGQDGALMLNDDRPGTVYCYATDSPCRLHNDDLMFSSELLFVAPASGTYYLQVKTPGSLSPVAGRYGSYRLGISVQ